MLGVVFFFSSRRRHTRWTGDWSSDVCSSDLDVHAAKAELEGKGVVFYSDVNVVDDGPLAGWRWVYFSDLDGLALELVEVAYYLKAERDAASAEYLTTRPPLAALEAAVG